MVDIHYNGNVVNSVISDINSIKNEFSSLSSDMKAATVKIVSSRGFNEYIGGISSDTFCGYVSECENAVSLLTQFIREKQINILSYSQDKEQINLFLDSLSRTEYNSLDLSSLENYISFGRKAGNFFKGVGSSIATFGLGLLEGVADFGETGCDLVTLGGSLFQSIFTLGYDAITGEETTKKLWEETRAKVSEKKVESVFNSFYNDTSIGKSIKENAYGFESVRGIGKGLGYSAGIIGVNILTGGLASGAIGAAGSIGAGQLALTAGLMGFSNGTEEAWADGATTGKGLLYGIATGAWEGTQWYLGAKINQFGGLGDQVASGLFKGANAGVGTRILMDTVDSGAEGFVQPALTMIYKDYGQGTFIDNYKTAFENAGGWKGVATQAAMGAIGSAVGEFSGARKLLKEAQHETDAAARRLFHSMLDEDESERAFIASVSAGGAFDAADFSRSGSKTIDGSYIHSGDHIFNTKSGKNIPDSYKWFIDGTYIPSDGNGLRGIFKQFESNIMPDEMRTIIRNNKQFLSGYDYTRLMKAVDIFDSQKVKLNVNELKLIVNHSEGNVGRIERALLMSYDNLPEDRISDISNRLAKELFSSSGGGSSLKSKIMNNYISARIRNGVDNWESSEQIIKTINSDKLLKVLSAETVTDRLARIKRIFGSGISEDTAIKLSNCDGYPSSIRKILMADPHASNYSSFADIISTDAAVDVFRNQNLARLVAVSRINDFDFKGAMKLVTQNGYSFDGYSDLLMATNAFSPKASRYAYYSIIDKFVAEGLPTNEAIKNAQLISSNALTKLGKPALSIHVLSSNLTIEDTLYNFNRKLFDSYSGSGSKISATDYMIKHYQSSDGKIDVRRIADDFKELIGKKYRHLSESVRTGSSGGIDLDYSKRASDLFISSYVDALNDVNNPNRGEAVRFMSKILELDSQGKVLSIVNNGGKTGSKCNGKAINLCFSTVDGNISGTVFHENGHYVFSNVLDAKYPTDFEFIRKRAVSCLDSAEAKALLRIYSENATEIKYYCSYLADKHLDDSLRRRNYDGISGYRDALIKKYSSMPVSSRNNALGDGMVKKGIATYTGYSQDFSGKLDFKDVELCADYELLSIHKKIDDYIFRTQFGDYTLVSSVIDSTTKGDIRYNYGHGGEYYDRLSDPNMNVFHELIADYSNLKVSGKNKTIGFLRSVLGNELIDTIDRTYQQMLK